MKLSFIAAKTALIMTFMALAGFQGCTPKTDTGDLPVKLIYNGTPESERTLTADEDGMFNFRIPVGYLPKGGVVDFNVNVTTTPECSKYYVTEFKAGNTWYKGDMFMCAGADKSHPSVVMQTFRMPEPVKGELDIRFRPTGREKADTLAVSGDVPTMKFAQYGYVGEYVQYFGTAVPQDTLNVLCVGNSFTYFSGAAAMLKEIAWNEGHLLRIKATLKGGRTFGDHLGLPVSRNVVNAGHYDYAFLQGQSQNPARYASDTTEFADVNMNFMKLTDRILSRSHNCHIVLESTWGYEAADYGGFGSYEAFDSLMTKGTAMMAHNASRTFGDNDFSVSPIGAAFGIVRDGNSGIDMYDIDRKHQSEYGSYLKACVNYLMIYGKPFASHPAEGATTSVDCGLPHDKAEYLRKIAEEVVLGR